MSVHFRVFLGSVVIGILLVAIWVVSWGKTFLDFARLEDRARATLTPAELQNWAIKLLTDQSELPRSKGGLQAQLLPQLRGLGRRQPLVEIRRDMTNGPSYVFIMYGGGFVGVKGFEIGPAEFKSLRSSHEWAPGVYFWAPQPEPERPNHSLE